METFNKHVHRCKILNFKAVMAAFALLAQLIAGAGCREEGVSNNFFQNNNNGGQTGASSWRNAGDIEVVSKNARSTFLGFNVTTPYNAHIDKLDGNRVVVSSYDGFIWRSVGLDKFPGVSDTAAPALVVYKTWLYVAFCDSADNEKVRVNKFYDGRWHAVSSETLETAISGKSASCPSIAVSEDIVFAGYIDGNNYGRPMVKRFRDRVGGAWETVGTGEVSAVEVSQLQVEAYQDIPYAAYIEKNSGRISVKKYDKNSNSWGLTGAAAFSSAYASYLSFKIDAGGDLYIAYCDGTNNSKLRVMKNTGTGWTSLDTAGVSDGPAEYSKIFIYDGVPYAAFCDHRMDRRASLMKYDGKKWNYLGSAGFSTGRVEDISLYVSYGVPYVSFIDKSDGDKVIVMKYEYIPQ